MEWVVGAGIFLFLLYTYPKQVGLTLVAIVAGATLIGGAIWLKQTSDAHEKSLVTINATYDPSSCSEAFPVRVVVLNGTGRTIERISFDLKAFRHGYSKEVILDYGLSSDFIMEPRHSAVACWSYTKPQDTRIIPADLEWKADLSYAAFRS